MTVTVVAALAVTDGAYRFQTNLILDASNNARQAWGKEVLLPC